MKKRYPPVGAPKSIAADFKKESHQFDKILKENLRPLIKPLIRRFMGMEAERLDFLPVTKQQTTLEREPDFICRLFCREFPEGVLLHLEFESQLDPDLVSRMLEYVGIERRRFRSEVLPVVVYVGAGSRQISTVIQEKYLQFECLFFRLADVPASEFLNAGTPEEVVFAILADFEGLSVEEILRLIFQKLVYLRGDSTALNKFLKQLRVLSQLRKLQPQTEKFLDSMIALEFDIEKDFIYQHGLAKGEAAGKIEGKIEGMTEANEIATFNMLDLDFEVEKIAGILSQPEGEILKMKKLWQLGRQVKNLAGQGVKTVAQVCKMLKIKPAQLEHLRRIEKLRKQKR